MNACRQIKFPMFKSKKYIRGHAVDHRQGDDLTSVQAMVDFMIFLLAHTRLEKGVFNCLYRWKKNTTHKSHTTHNGAGVNHPGETVTTVSPLIKCRLSGSSLSSTLTLIPVGQLPSSQSQGDLHPNSRLTFFQVARLPLSQSHSYLHSRSTVTSNFISVAI